MHGHSKSSISFGCHHDCHAKFVQYLLFSASCIVPWVHFTLGLGCVCPYIKSDTLHHFSRKPSQYVWKKLLVVIQLLSNVWLFVTLWTADARLPCSSLSPSIYSNSCLLSWWFYLTISSSAVPLSFCLQFFPSTRVFSKEFMLCIRWPNYWSFTISLFNEH